MSLLEKEILKMRQKGKLPSKKSKRGRRSKFDQLLDPQKRSFFDWCRGEKSLERTKYICGVGRATLYRWKDNFYNPLKDANNQAEDLTGIHITNELEELRKLLRR